jgi:hypothetical protein
LQCLAFAVQQLSTSVAAEAGSRITLAGSVTLWSPGTSRVNAVPAFAPDTLAAGPNSSGINHRQTLSGKAAGGTLLRHDPSLDGLSRLPGRRRPGIKADGARD